MFNEICRIVGVIVITHYVVDHVVKVIDDYVASKQEKEAMVEQ